MRVSDADRDQVAETLREAAAEGRITLEELDERLELTYSSRVYADLEPIVADLPSTPGSDLAQSPAADVSPVAGQSGDALVINAKGDTTVRKGTWEVPARVEANARWGTCKLDLRDARLTAQVTEIWIDVTGGSGDIILPEGATAHVDVDSSWFGSLKSQVDTIRKQGVPHFVITGEAKGGGLTVRYKRSSGFLSIFGV